MIAALFTELGTIITSFGTLLVSAFNGAVSIFWSGTAITSAGSFLLLGMGVGIFYFAFGWIRRLIRARG